MQPIRTDAIATADLHAGFAAAFADYLLPLNLSLAQWPNFLARQAADLALGRAVRDADGAVQAFVLVAPRSDNGRWRIAGMGATTAARGSGAAAALLDDALARAGAAGASGCELEVFAQNPRAVALYRRHGFAERHVLHGFQHAAPAAPAAAPGGATALPLPEAFDRIEAFARRDGNVPMQATPAGLRSSQGLVAWSHGDALLVFGATAAPAPVQVHTLLDAAAGQAGALHLIAQLAATHPERVLRVPQWQRDDLGGHALRAAGWRPEPLHQLLMTHMF